MTLTFSSDDDAAHLKPIVVSPEASGGAVYIMPPKPRAPHRGRDPNAEPSALQGAQLDPEEEYNFDTAGCARTPHPTPT